MYPGTHLSGAFHHDVRRLLLDLADLVDIHAEILNPYPGKGRAADT